MLIFSTLILMPPAQVPKCGVRILERMFIFDREREMGKGSIGNTLPGLVLHVCDVSHFYNFEKAL